MKICPNCGSNAVRPAKAIDEWASIEEQMQSRSGDIYECDECGHKGELIGIQEAPEEEEILDPVEKPEEPQPIEIDSPKPVKVNKKISKKKKKKGR